MKYLQLQADGTVCKRLAIAGSFCGEVFNFG
jgi:hypothetical protein